MQYYPAIYERLLELISEGHPIKDYSYAGRYIEYFGRGFNRICLYDYEYDPQSPLISLAIHAGDTCAQARELFTHFSASKVKELEENGWTVTSNFHLAWQRKIIFTTEGDRALDLREYIDYWRRVPSKEYIRKYNKDEFGLLLERMKESKVANRDDIERFNEYFRTHKYQSAITCPGIVNRISYSKERLNDIETLAAELNEKKRKLIEIYRQDYVPAPRP
jgi:hypothetical protein